MIDNKSCKQNTKVAVCNFVMVLTYQCIVQPGYCREHFSNVVCIYFHITIYMNNIITNSSSSIKEKLKESYLVRKDEVRSPTVYEIDYPRSNTSYISITTRFSRPHHRSQVSKWQIENQTLLELRKCRISEQRTTKKKTMGKT